MIFVTSDTHYGHKNVIQYCSRPFADVYEMNETMVKNWNSVVTEEDIVYHLGDFSMNHFNIPKYLPRLKAKEIHLIAGNHDKPFKGSDKWIKQYLNYGFTSVSNVKLLEVELDSKNMVTTVIRLMHLPYRDGRTRKEDKLFDYRLVDDGVFALTGHSHSPKINRLKFNRLDIGVDAWDFTPVPLPEVIKEIKKADVFNYLQENVGAN